MKEYIEKLKEYTEKKNISVYDYYYALGTLCRKYKSFKLVGFEAKNPFLTKEDLDKLVKSDDELMPEFFARAMTKVVELNEKKIAEESLSKQQIKEVVEDEYAKKEQEAEKPEMGMIPYRPVCKALIPVTKEETLTRSDIESEINKKLENVAEESKEATIKDTKENAQEKLAEKVPTEPKKETSREPSTPASETINKKDIMEAINEAMNKLTGENLPSTTAPSKESLPAVKVNKKKSLFNITSINLGLIGKLKGLALIKDSKSGKADIYLHDPKTKTLKGRKTVSGTKAESGYYVNYQEYIYKMFDDVMKKHPEASSIKFVDEEQTERSIEEVVEEVFKTLREAGAIRFGDEYATAQIRTYKDLKGIKPGYATFANEKLKKGIYVRSDILREELRKYRLRISMQKAEAKTYKKTK